MVTVLASKPELEKSLNIEYQRNSVKKLRAFEAPEYRFNFTQVWNVII